MKNDWLVAAPPGHRVGFVVERMWGWLGKPWAPVMVRLPIGTTGPLMDDHLISFRLPLAGTVVVRRLHVG